MSLNQQKSECGHFFQRRLWRAQVIRGSLRVLQDLHRNLKRSAFFVSSDPQFWKVDLQALKRDPHMPSRDPHAPNRNPHGFSRDPQESNDFHTRRSQSDSIFDDPHSMGDGIWMSTEYLGTDVFLQDHTSTFRVFSRSIGIFLNGWRERKRKCGARKEPSSQQMW